MAKRTRRGTFLAAGAAAAAAASPAGAATITVNSLNDTNTAGDGQCTLREAVANANANADTTGGDCVAGAGADVINIPLAGTITLTGGRINITETVNIAAPTAGTVTIDGNNASGIFYANNNADVDIRRLTLTRGSSPSRAGAIGMNHAGFLTLNTTVLTGNTATGKGGAVSLYRSTGLVLQDSQLTNNTAGSRGGGLFLYNVTGAVSITNSTVSGNTSANRGGGLFLYKTAGTLDISDSSISGNSAFRGGALFLYKTSSVVSIQRSTISGNSSNVSGGGFFFYKTNAAHTIVDSTISGNTSTTGNGGGIYLLGAFGGGHVLNLQFTTMFGNTAAGSGGNIEGGGSANTINIANSIIAGGVAPTGPDINSAAATVNMDFSLLQNTANATVVGGNNITGVSPLLGPLANNGGPTLTHLPAAGSPVIDAGSAAIVPVPANDQRAQPRVAGAAPDMGSVEQLAPAPPGVGGGGPIPTLSEWALGLLAALMAWFGMRRSRR